MPRQILRRFRTTPRIAGSGTQVAPAHLARNRSGSLSVVQRAIIVRLPITTAPIPFRNPNLTHCHYTTCARSPLHGHASDQNRTKPASRSVIEPHFSQFQYLTAQCNPHVLPVRLALGRMQTWGNHGNRDVQANLMAWANRPGRRVRIDSPYFSHQSISSFKGRFAGISRSVDRTTSAGKASSPTPIVSAGFGELSDHAGSQSRVIPTGSTE